MNLIRILSWRRDAYRGTIAGALVGAGLHPDDVTAAIQRLGRGGTFHFLVRSSSAASAVAHQLASLGATVDTVMDQVPGDDPRVEARAEVSRLVSPSVAPAPRLATA